MKFVACAGLFVLLAAAARAQEWSPPTAPFVLPERGDGPVVACTKVELERLRAAYRGFAKVVRDVVARAEQQLTEPVEFPPRGGQHNQWYQCEACQMGLVTKDATHHACPSCKKVYTGEPYDDVVFAKVHGKNFRQALDCAWAHAITGEERFAVRSAEILLGYADRYERYPYHDIRRGKKLRSGGHIEEQTLGEASLLATAIAPAFDLIASYLKESAQQRIVERLVVPMLKNIDKHKAGKSNWQTWHNAAMVCGGAVIGDAAWLQKAIVRPRHGFLSQMEESVTADGMWYENSWGYHFYTLRALTVTAAACRRLGIDLWGHPKLLAMYTLPVQYTMADQSLPRFGDDVNSSVASVREMLEYAYAGTGDEALLPQLSAGPTFASVLLGRDQVEQASAEALQSRVFEAAGHAILRNPAGMTAAFTFGPFGGFHGHFDKLSFVLFAHGRELAVDPGRAKSQAYRLPIHAGWYRATLAHNTVTVDRASQEGVAGELRLFAMNRDAVAAAALVDEAYSGVTHERLLVLMPDYLLVVDDLKSRRPHEYDWAYHARANQVKCGVVKGDADWRGEYPGTEYIRSARRGVSDEALRVHFTDSKVETWLHVAGDKQTTVTIGDGPVGSIHERSPMVLLGREARRANFAVAIEPVVAGKKPTVTEVVLDHASRSWTVEVSRKEGRDTITYEPGRSVRVQRDGVVLLVGDGKDG